MATEYQLTLNDYLSVARRRSLYLIGIFAAVFLGAVVIAIIMPPTYRSTGTILVESQQVPDNVVAATSNPLEERINGIRQRVMTRESLLRIANKHKIFKENEGSKTTTELIEKMRERISVEAITTADSSLKHRPGKQQTIAFSLSYDDRHSDVAYNAAKDLIALFLEWNAKLRTMEVADTALFLSQETDKIKAEVQRLDKEIVEYKAQNNGSLPEQMELRSNMLARAEKDLYEVEREIRGGKDALYSLETDLSMAKSSLGDQPSQELPKLKSEYVKLSAIYTDSHPDIRALKRKIEALESATDTPKAEADLTIAPSLAVVTIQSKIDTISAKLDSLTKQKEMLKRKILENERAIDQVPRVRQGLETLMRERDSAQKKYEEFYNKKVNARIVENLESENKSERFTLLEPPIMPEKPIKPDRIKIIVLGFILAIASSGGMLLLIPSIDQQIRGVDALTYVMGRPPLVVIPYITTNKEDMLRKRNIKLVAAASALIIASIVVALHTFYMPLDILWQKILARLL